MTSRNLVSAAVHAIEEVPGAGPLSAEEVSLAGREVSMHLTLADGEEGVATAVREAADSLWAARMHYVRDLLLAHQPEQEMTIRLAFPAFD